MKTITVRRMSRKSNFDKTPRFLMDGLRATVIVTANVVNDEWDEAGAKEIADCIANAFNNPKHFRKGTR